MWVWITYFLLSTADVGICYLSLMLVLMTYFFVIYRWCGIHWQRFAIYRCTALLMWIFMNADVGIDDFRYDIYRWRGYWWLTFFAIYHWYEYWWLAFCYLPLIWVLMTYFCYLPLMWVLRNLFFCYLPLMWVLMTFFFGIYRWCGNDDLLLTIYHWCGY